MSGTTRTSPENSPGTQALDWDYYRNLTASDFDCFTLNDMFKASHFYYNKFSRDLYFLGIKSGDAAGRQLPWIEAELTATLQPAFAYKPERMLQKGSLRYLYFLFRQKNLVSIPEYFLTTPIKTSVVLTSLIRFLVAGVVWVKPESRS